MKKGFERIVAWKYDGRTAIGVLHEDNETISVAVNYRMDSNIKEGDLWYMDSIYKDEGTEIRLATELEIRTLLNALHDNGVSYVYDEETRTIRICNFSQTTWTRFKEWVGGLFSNKRQ